MATSTEISNLAISHLGIGKEITNLDTERSQEALACKRFFETAKKSVLADHDWSFATKTVVLGLIETSPTNEWAYSYRYPSDCINARRIPSGIRNETQSSRIVFKITKDDVGKLVYTDQPDASLEYTEDVSNTSLFSAEFDLALSFLLAAYIAPRITGGDPFKIKGEMLTQYRLEIENAKKKNMNEDIQDTEPDSEFITTRS